MFLADALSRLKQHDNEPDQTAQSEFEREIETICAVEDAQFDDQMLERLKMETAQDKTLTIVAQLVSQGWPAERRETPIEARPYFGHREELTMYEGAISKGCRFVSPSSMRREMLQEELHRAHMGVEATLRRARQTIFWP